MRKLIYALPLLMLIQVLPAGAESTTVRVPIALDFTLLQHLLIGQLFTSPEQSRELLEDNNDCNQITLTRPRITAREDKLEILAHVDTRLGFNLFGTCIELPHWQGQVGYLGEPVVQPGGSAVRLETRDSWLMTSAGTPITSGKIWDYVKAPMQAMYGSFTVDLTPYTQSIDSLLPVVLPDRSAEQLQAILDSMRLDALQVAADRLNLALLFDVETMPAADPVPKPSEAALSAEELEQSAALWQMMDSLMVVAVKQYAAATGMEELHNELLEVLIDSRYQLGEVLADSGNPSRDRVRHWFLDSWQRLNPVVRRIAVEQDNQQSLLWLTLITATDALYAMDQIGSSIGLQISEDGLRRLARLINQNIDPDTLRYDEAVDPELQRLFRQLIESEATAAPGFTIRFSLFAGAHAAAAPDRLNNWVPAVSELGQYVPMMADLLGNSSGSVLQKYSLQNDHKKLFNKMVLATAWQESCWRQYVIKDNRIQPLLSSTGDVGVMQLNERVWRGFYDLQKLRWDIDYNSKAGAEVLLDFFVKYALKQGEHNRPGGMDNLARASYSAYNGGPRQFARYRKSDVTPYQKKVDQAFWEKYQRVKAGKERDVSQCLGGQA